MDVLLLALTWEDFLMVMIAAGLGAIAGIVWAKKGSQMWPWVVCETVNDVDVQAIEYLVNILKKANDPQRPAPEPHRTIINELVGVLMMRDRGDCGHAKKASAAADAGNWDLVISELEHAG